MSCDNEGHVTSLDLDGESISGEFHDSSVLFSLQHLQKLNLADNNFSSVIPSGFKKLNKLTYLNLSHAGFAGQVPIHISQMTRLVTLDLSSSFSTGEVLKQLEIPNLQKLVQNLTSIRKLYLDGVSVTVPGHEWCSALISLHDLQELRMSYCNVSGPLDASLARLANLSVIVLDYNNISSPVPETFARFKNLTILGLVNCGLTGTFPQNRLRKRYGSTSTRFFFTKMCFLPKIVEMHSQGVLNILKQLPPPLFIGKKGGACRPET